MKRLRIIFGGENMNLCSDGHSELCYEGRFCPACEIMKDRDYFDEQIGVLEKEIQQLKDYITELEKGE
jgi:hypothetical protein